jgi:eukaryotic-like serine/threonine-protein kinase
MANQPPSDDQDVTDVPENFLDAGLAAAFRSVGPVPPQPSVLAALRSEGQHVSQVLLRDQDSGVSPLVQPLSAERPAFATEGGRYQLLGEIARGGVGAVFKGRDRDLGRDIAVKVLLSKHADDPVLLRRFMEEAQIGGQLQHPGIVPVFEVGQVNSPGANDNIAGLSRSLDADPVSASAGRMRPYFTMKLVKGRTLAVLLEARSTPLEDRPRFLAIFEQVCQTMAYAHARGVLHRDLKPSNIMVGAFNEVQVMDWGLAKVLTEGGAEDDRKTHPHRPALPMVSSVIQTVRTEAPGTESLTGSVLGTPAYMPPEQARGEVDRLDERSDVFALGAILCEILTGKPPYSGETTEELNRRSANADLADAYQRLEAADLDEELLRIAKRCLEASPRDRPRDAGVLAKELTAYLAGVETRLEAAETAKVEADARANYERRSRRLVLGLAGAVLAAVLLATGGWLWLDQERQTRLAETAFKVNSALAEANLLRGQAKGTPDNPANWSAAVSAAKRAEGLLAGGEADDDLRGRVANLLNELGAEQEAAVQAKAERERDREMAAWLDEIRLEKSTVNGSDLDIDRGDALYAGAYRVYGIDVEQLPPEEAARQIAGRPIRQELVVALDDWAWGGSRKRKQQTSLEQKLVTIAQIADPDPWRNRLRSALSAKDLAALKELTTTQERDRLTTTSWDLLGRALVDFKAPEAVTWLREAQRRFPSDFWIELDLVAALSNLDQDDQESLRYCTAALALRPQHLVVLSNMGYSLQQQGRYDEAIRTLRECIRINPGHAPSHSNLGLALARHGDRSQAEAACRKAIDLQPGNPNFHNNLGSIIVAPHRLAEKEACFRRTISLESNFGVARVNLANCLRQQARLDEAEAACRKALALDPNSADSYLTLGRILSEMDKDVAAEEACRKAIELMPQHAASYEALGDVLRNRNTMYDAEIAYRRAIALKPRSAGAYQKLGVLLRGVRRFDEAIEAHQEAMRLAPADPVNHSNLGNALSDKKRFDEALAEQREAMRLDPDFGPAYGNYAFALGGKQQHAEIVRFYEETVHKNPKLELAESFFRYNTACSAVLLGCGKLKDAPTDEHARAVLRQKALDWLRADLNHFTQRYAKNRSRLPRIQRGIVQNWKRDTDLSPVRDKEGLSRLPPAEQAAWRTFWADVDNLLGK